MVIHIATDIIIHKEMARGLFHGIICLVDLFVLWLLCGRDEILLSAVEEVFVPFQSAKVLPVLFLEGINFK